MKIFGECKFAFSSNSVCLIIKPNTVMINRQLEFSGTRVKYLDREKKLYKH